MQAPNARRRVAAATPAVPSVGAATSGLPVLRFTMHNGVLEIEGAAMVTQLLQNEQRARLAAEAEQAALSVCYKVAGQPDSSKPYNGLLTQRLGISERTALQLLRDGKLRYTCAGAKNYRISELAVREFLGDLPSTK